MFRKGRKRVDERERYGEQDSARKGKTRYSCEINVTKWMGFSEHLGATGGCQPLYHIMSNGQWTFVIPQLKLQNFFPSRLI